MLSTGWLRGFPNRLDRRWASTPLVRDGQEVISVGGQLTGALAFLRLFEITGKEVYRQKGVALGEQTMKYGWDSLRGAWFDYVGRTPPHTPPPSATVSWWIQCYGAFLQLHLYHITSEHHYLDQFLTTTTFWNQYFLDRELGGVFRTVSAAGVPIDSEKAIVWKASYHEMEHSLLNYLYLNLYVSHKPAVLHFLLRDTKAQSRHVVSLAEDPSVRIGSVRIDGKPWTRFNAEERYVVLPEAKEVTLEVTLIAGR